MAKYVKADGTVTDVFPANKKSFTLEEMQILVGGYIEMVPSNHPQFMLTINEEGKLDSLPVNQRATQLCTEIGLMPGDVIVGDVIIGTKTEFGYDEE